MAKNKGGRPEINLTDDQIIQIEALAATLNSHQIADYLGINRATFYRIMERDERVKRQYKRGKAKAISKVADSLLDNALDGDTAAICFYLKTQAGWREKKEDETQDKQTTVNITFNKVSKRGS